MSESTKHRRIAITIVILAIALTVAASEITLRVFLPGPRYAMREFVLELDRRVLFRLPPGSHPEINDLGYRDAEPGRKDPGRTRIAVLGDSFVMGYNVPTDRTLPAGLARLVGDRYDVLNMGIYGYGPDQALVRFIDEADRIEPDIVVLVLFPANDFNDLLKNDLVTVGDGGSLAFTETNPVSRALPAFRTSSLVRRVVRGSYLDPAVEESLFELLFVDAFDLITDRSSPVARKKIALMQLVLREFRVRAERIGAAFRVVIVPSYEAMENPASFERSGLGERFHLANEDLAASVCDSLGIPYLDLAAEFRSVGEAGLYDAEDHHLSERGNRVAAAALRRFLVDSGAVESP